MSRDEIASTRRSRVGRHIVRGFRPENLRAARLSANNGRAVEVRDLARVSGVGMTTIRNWESGESVPQVDKLRKIAEVLGISVPMDELIDVPRAERSPTDWRALFGLLQPTLGRIVGIETTTVGHIESGVRVPKPEQAAAIAKVYGISVDEFMECFERARRRPLDSGY